jgi:elongation factor Ts
MTMEINSALVKKLREATGLGMMDCKKALEETNGDFEAAIDYLRKQGLKSATKRADRAMKEGRIEALVNKDSSSAVIVELNTETDFVARTNEFIAYTKKFAEFFLSKGPDAGFGEDAASAGIDISGMTLGGLTAEIIAKTGENTQLGRWKRYKKAAGEYLDCYIHPGNKLGVILKVKVSDESKLSLPRFREFAQDIAMQIAAAAPLAVNQNQLDPKLINKERELMLGQLEQEEEKSGKKKPQEIREIIVDGRMGKFFQESCLLEQIFVKDQNKKVSQVITEVGKELNTTISVEAFTRYLLGEDYR